MCDEHTWHHKTFPVQIQHLAVKLYCVFEREFSFSQCFCSFQGADGKRQRGVVDQEQILVSNHFHCLDCLQLGDLVSVMTQYPDEYLMMYPIPQLEIHRLGFTLFY